MLGCLDVIQLLAYYNGNETYQKIDEKKSSLSFVKFEYLVDQRFVVICV
jgi:hypothetical protein